MLLEAIDEELRDQAQVLLLGETETAAYEVDSELYQEWFQLSAGTFATAVQNTYGSRQESHELEVPGLPGLVPIPLGDLRNLEEDFDVLHSRILMDAPDGNTAISPDAFWRGSPPTWADLHAGVDVVRDIHLDLVKELRKRLEDRRNHTVQLYHKPGAGGTTTALRAAWTLRDSYPTIVLRRNPKNLVDRIDRLFQRTQLPVLVVAEAEAATLPPAASDQLHYGLNSRNARAVVLHVIRSAKLPHDKSFVIPDPMSYEEAAEFDRVFRSRTHDLSKQKQIDDISVATDPQLALYRSPFFYGLITYEEEFTKIGEYVQRHLAEASDEARKILRYLALVTYYSQTTLDETLVQSLLGLSTEARLNVEEALGASPAHLVLHQGRRLKLMHPLIGRELLAQCLGGSDADHWRDNLKELAREFINEVVDVQGDNAEETHNLFLEVFIRRGGQRKSSSQEQSFSELISDISGTEGQLLVLKELTK